jgi:hypothetical protein
MLRSWPYRLAAYDPAVRLAGCAIMFACGPADRITAVVLAGRGAPKDPVGGLHYRVTAYSHDRLLIVDSYYPPAGGSDPR